MHVAIPGEITVVKTEVWGCWLLVGREVEVIAVAMLTSISPSRYQSNEGNSDGRKRNEPFESSSRCRKRGKLRCAQRDV